MGGNDLSSNDTLPKLLVKMARERGAKKAMFHKDLGVWQEYSWDEYLTEVKYFALGLKNLGLERGARLSILGDNDPHWYWAELAAQSLGAVPVGIFSDAITSELHYLMTNSDSTFLIASDQEQIDKALEIQDRTPLIKKVIFWEYNGLDNYDDPILMSWEDVRDLGKSSDRDHPDAFLDEVSQGKGEDVCFILYTSGTSGAQKGAMRTHRNYLSGAVPWVKELGLTEKDRHFAFYSPAWIVEQHDGIGASLVSGQVTYFPESADTALTDMREVGPTIFFSASRIWEGLCSTIQVKIMDASWFNRFVYNLLLPIGKKKADLVMKKERQSLWFGLLHKFADTLVFARLRDRMGLLRIRAGVTAGALLSPDAFQYFWTLGIPIRQVYGLTEMAPITMHQGGDLDKNTIGTPMSGVEVRQSEDGEIQVKGENCFVGYYNKPEASEEALEGGWFHTGDWGYLNDNGHLIIYDRLKDAVKLKTGHRFAPQYIESQLKFSPYINDAVVIGGEEYNYVSVIINIEFDNISKWADKNRVNYLTFTDLSQKKEVYDLVHREIKRINENLPEETRVKRFANLYKQLDADEAELTRTRKVKRNVFEDKYRAVIDALYGSQSTIDVETEVKYRDGKTSRIRTSVSIRDV